MDRSTIGFRGALVAALALALTASLRPAAAQDYPSRQITLLVGFAAGGYADAMARLIGQKLGDRLHQSVVVENRGGAGGNIAAKVVASSPADGYTVLVTTTGLAVNQTLSKNKGFDASDLKAVAIPVSTPETLSVNPNNPAKTLAEFVKNAKGKSITFATAGVGTGSHLAAEFFFRNIAKIEAVHVPFQGGAPAVNALLGGHVDAMGASMSGIAGQLKSGKIRGLAVASEKRVPNLPNVPTYGEGGYPGFYASSWVGFFVPAKTSDAIAAKLNAEINAILDLPDVQKKLEPLSVVTRHANQPESEAYFKSEIETWGKMVHAVGLKPI